MELEKISAEQIHAVLADAVVMLPKLAQQRDDYKTKCEELQAKVASYERRGAIDKLATDMREKGLDSGKSHEELMTDLEVWAQQGKLAEVQRAVELTGPDMGQKIAQVYNDGAGSETDLTRYLGSGGGSDNGGGSGGSGSDFMRFLLSGQ